MVFPNLTAVAVSFSLSIVALGLNYLVIRRYRKCREAWKHQGAGFDVSDEILLCVYFHNQNCGCHRKDVCKKWCAYKHLNKIVSFMDSAKHTISLCMGIVTVIEIQDALLRAQNRGVRVRFISDITAKHIDASRAKFLKNAGIAIRMASQSTTARSSKYCLVDEDYPGEANLFFGPAKNLTTVSLKEAMHLFTQRPDF